MDREVSQCFWLVVIYSFCVTSKFNTFHLIRARQQDVNQMERLTLLFSRYPYYNWMTFTLCGWYVLYLVYRSLHYHNLLHTIVSLPLLFTLPSIVYHSPHWCTLYGFPTLTPMTIGDCMGMKFGSGAVSLMWEASTFTWTSTGHPCIASPSL